MCPNTWLLCWGNFTINNWIWTSWVVPNRKGSESRRPIVPISIYKCLPIKGMAGLKGMTIRMKIGRQNMNSWWHLENDTLLDELNYKSKKENRKKITFNIKNLISTSMHGEFIAETFFKNERDRQFYFSGLSEKEMENLVYLLIKFV